MTARNGRRKGILLLAAVLLLFRPAWAAPDDLWKQESRAFYREEEKNRRFFPHLSAYDHKQLSGLTHFEVLEHLGKRAVFDYTQRDPVTGNAGMRVI